ncbi:MAG TPA: glycogen/starch/alpha-glucan phosphorylase [Pseudomonadales bacterium]|nr:glycogen/starch/alpha-glucan phosphorylase [Pseudomonadales bacterium]
MVQKNENGHVLARQAGFGRGGLTVEDFKRAIVDNLYYERGQGAYTASAYDIYVALVYTVRDHLMDRWRKTIDATVSSRPKFVYYLSAEYLPGRQISQNLLYTGTWEIARQALKELGYDLDQLIELEPEPALGNGGLGRLAACYMDSMATLDIPSISYGIHYEFGIFKQSFKDGWQVESPDDWLYHGNPWEFPQPDNMIKVGFGGQVEHFVDALGRFQTHWIPAETVMGEPAHKLVPGYQTDTVNLLRLWRAKASKEFDFQLFDVGDYSRAAEQKIESENISKVLYPNDNTPQGRELRLKQEYFFVACSLRDILRRFLVFDQDWNLLPERLVIQINDTHPVVVIPELMRLLVDEYQLPWDQAWSITTRVIAYTCHTLLPEALEKWPVALFEHLLPRHLEIIYEINRRFLEEVRNAYPGDTDRIARMSIIEEWPVKSVRMAHLASIACFSINGVAELHSNLLKRQVLRDFYTFYPDKFNNKTNGVSPRRFMQLANPRLSDLITQTIGDGWQRNLEKLSGLQAHADDPAFQNAWQEIKRQNKVALAAVILDRNGVVVDPDSMFDVMVKRLHEYKRQLLKTLHIIALYNRLKATPSLDIIPRTFIFGAKSAPGYQMAKLIIKLMNSVADTVNNDPTVGGKLKMAFMPNFNVTLGEKIYPAAELSEQISLAGYEASGTGNMKFALNGAVTIGTLDGANIEIRERVGADNFFLFGLTAAEVLALKSKGYTPYQEYARNSELKNAIDMISLGAFSNGDKDLFRPIVNELLNRDTFLHLVDFSSFMNCQDEVDQAYRNRQAWTRKSIINSARSGYFSSDRSVTQYCEEIWKAKPIRW